MTPPAARPALERRGARVRVAPVQPGDEAPYRHAVELSRARMQEWNPVDPEGAAAALAHPGRDRHAFLVHALHPDPDAGHDLVGSVNVNSVVLGRLRGATLGYNAFDPYAGHGLFAEGLRLVVDLAFAPTTQGGLGLHRLEANVQPRNVRSAAVLRRLGFTREGFSPGYLWIAGPTGHESWRDHDRYAVLASEWPAAAYLQRRRRPVVALVNGLPGSGKTTLGRALADELGVPFLGKDLLKEGMADGLGEHGTAAGSARLGATASELLWSLLAASPGGGVVESVHLPGRDEAYVAAGLRRAGHDPADVPEVWCDLPPEVARERFEARARRGRRHPVHGPQQGLDAQWERWSTAAPLGLGPVLPVATGERLTPADLARLALAVRAVRA
ncbi:GNAT family N-acetyltransferase [Lapillicoccus jejuensis]|uniref:Ribosomal-protein-alanine N-acetyltransferase n=1 Tax=Lapillicoccus jejuensis TaxID=402171 RepID=A0A542E3K0_9MICO|nr:GNAT family N-acetyltransferase [Lapillicoccus jejuensis]TQJ09824.1 ribosomal-protein-alanine N-acetyltransferase [Lapillicoccus jejuensis]